MKKKKKKMQKAKKPMRFGMCMREKRVGKKKKKKNTQQHSVDRGKEKLFDRRITGHINNK